MATHLLGFEVKGVGFGIPTSHKGPVATSYAFRAPNQPLFPGSGVKAPLLSRSMSYGWPRVSELGPMLQESTKHSKHSDPTSAPKGDPPTCAARRVEGVAWVPCRVV